MHPCILESFPEKRAKSTDLEILIDLLAYQKWKVQIAEDFQNATDSIRRPEGEGREKIYDFNREKMKTPTEKVVKFWQNRNLEGELGC